MVKFLLGFLILLVGTLFLWTQPVSAARQTKAVVTPTAVLVCFSGGQEVIRKQVVEGPFADEYKFAREIKVMDDNGEHWLNFAGGICVIDRGEAPVKSQLKLTDELTCYSGGTEVLIFEVYGKETTVDEYLEGRTFLAKAKGKSFNSDSLHRYLLFGGGTCIGEETQ